MYYTNVNFLNSEHPGAARAAAPACIPFALTTLIHVHGSKQEATSQGLPGEQAGHGSVCADSP